MFRQRPKSALFPYTTLFRSLKKHAAESGTSVSGLIGRAVRLLLQAPASQRRGRFDLRSEEHTSELQSRVDLVCRLLLEKKDKRTRCTMGRDLFPFTSPRRWS